MPTDDGSVTRLVAKAKCNDSEATQKLFDRYWKSLIGVARKHLSRRIAKMNDEEDLALSVFNSFLGGANKGRFPQITDRHDLWKILLILARRKAASYARAALASKRNGSKEGSIFDDSKSIEELVSSEPSPEFVIMAADLCNSLLDSLPDDELRTVAAFKLEGLSARDISVRLNRTVRTVERKIERIQLQWSAYEESLG